MSQRPLFGKILSDALPHLVARELRGLQAAARDTAGCPDADTLTAYVEKSITATEQSAIVEHLNRCEHCRLSVVFAMHAGMASQPSAPRQGTLFSVPARASFLPWAVAGGVAAGLLAAFVFFWQPVPVPRIQQASIAVPVENAFPSPVAPERVRRVRPAVSLQPLPARPSAPVLTATAGTPVSKRAILPAHSMPIRQGFATLSSDHSSRNPVLPGLEVASTSLHSDGPTAATPLAANSLPGSGMDSATLPSLPMASSFMGSAVSAPPRAWLASSSSAPVSADRLGFSQFITHRDAAPSWRISKAGTLEHTAGRGMWVRVPFQAAGRLVSLTVSGTHLWVVSQNGALYHSADDGQNWHPVHVDLDRHALQDAIIGVHFTDQRQGELMTRSGARWFTLDGGHFWKPVLAPSLLSTVPTRH